MAIGGLLFPPVSRFDVAALGRDSAEYHHLWAEVTKRGQAGSTQMVAATRMTLSELRQRFVRRMLLDGTALDTNGALDLDAAYPDVDASYGGGDNDDNIELF